MGRHSMILRLRPILWATATLLLLAAPYFALKFLLDEPAPPSAHTQVYRLWVPAPRPSTDAPVLRALQGDTVTLVIRSNQAGEVHVHGYEKKVVLQPGSEVRLSFAATRAGAFPVHFHDADGSMRHLAMLEVQPR